MVKKQAFHDGRSSGAFKSDVRRLLILTSPDGIKCNFPMACIPSQVGDNNTPPPFEVPVK
jgi:hypothetical protein